MKEKIMNILKNKKIIIPVAAVLVVAVAVGCIVGLSKKPVSGNAPVSSAQFPLSLSDVTISPDNGDDNGIDASSALYISTPADYKAEEIAALLTVEPETGFNVTRESAGKYVMKFDELLTVDSIYNLVMTDSPGSAESAAATRSWAFQTRKDFRVISCLPGDGSSSVPTDSGIEITFSHADVADIENYFTIEPEVSGRFEKNGKTFIFVPSGFEEDTFYKVTISKDLKNGSGDDLGEDKVFSFRTGYEDEGGDGAFLMGDFVTAFTPDTIPSIAIYARGSAKEKPFDVTVYKYNSENDYISSLRQQDEYVFKRYGSIDRYHIDTAGLSKVAQFETKLVQKGGNTWDPTYIVFPESLSEGYYLVDMNVETDSGVKNVQKLVQVNSMAVYVMSTEDALTVWVNDTGSGDVISGAKISLNGRDKGTTDKDGMAILNVLGESGYGYEEFSYIRVDGGKSAFIAQVRLFESAKGIRPADYFTYVYTDRETYLPTDKVNVWGIVKPRDLGEGPSKVTLKLRSWGDSEVLPLFETTAAVSEYGGFEAQIPLENLASAEYYINVSIDDTVMRTKNIYISDYVKPAYTAQTYTDKAFYNAWDTIDVSANVSFFDGTPASNMKLNLWLSRLDMGNYSSSNIGLETDKSGGVRHTFNLAGAGDSWRPSSIEYDFSNAQAEDEDFSAWGSIGILPSDMMLRTEYSREKRGLDVYVNEIDTSNIKTREDLYSRDVDTLLRGDAAESEVTIDIIKTTNHKVEDGEYYDYIEKKTVKNYHYYQTEETVSSFPKTIRGEGFFPVSVANIAENESYRIEASLKDRHGTVIKETAYIPGSGSDTYDYKTYNFSNDKYLVKTGEKFTANLAQNYTEMTSLDEGGRVMALVLKDGIIDRKVTSSAKVEFTFDEKYSPNVQVLGAYFDGKNIYRVLPMNFSIDPEDHRMDISVKTEKSEYAPGEKVKIEIIATDKGKPVSAEVCVGIVDEAAFTAGEQSVDPLFDIYRSAYYATRWMYASYDQNDGMFSEGGAEKGGEGGGGRVRSDFKDTALFTVAETDEDGRAFVMFHLPDNLTSWRITTQAVSKDMDVAYDKKNITTKLPFFTDILSSKLYTEGDELVISARAFGTALGKEDKVSFVAVLSGENGEKIAERLATGTYGEYMNINFGVFKEGTYKVMVKASHGVMSDAMEEKVTVVKSAVTVPIISDVDFKDRIAVSASKYPVTLSFCDNAYSLFFKGTQSLMMGVSSARVDAKAAAAAALEILKKYSDEEDKGILFLSGVSEDEISGFQSYEGAVSLLSYSEDDPCLTAMMCVAAPQYINTATAATYLTSVLDDEDMTEEQVCAAIMGLSSLKRPVLTDARSLLSGSAGELSDESKLYLVAAIGLIGDEYGAKEAFDKYVSPKLIEIGGKLCMAGDAKPTERIGDDALALTAKALVAAVKADRNAADKLMNTLVETRSNKILTALEKLSYLRFCEPKNASDAAFNVTIDGKTTKVDLSKQGVKFISFTESTLSGAKFEKISGDIAVTAAYEGALSDILDSGNRILDIRKSMSTVSGGDMRQSELVKITITPEFDRDMPEGMYEVQDVIPAGMRFVSYKDSGANNRAYLQSRDGQKVTFVFFRGKNDEAKDMPTIEYYVRCTLPGTFVSENAYIRNEETGEWGISAREMVKIGG